MGLSFQMLGSSSRGNCALVETAHCRLLIDAGFSGRRICRELDSAGKPVSTVDAVFLTHEHTDHAAGVRGLAKFDHLSFYANYPTAQAVQQKLNRQLKWKLFETGTVFRYNDLTVETIRLPHDSYEPVGFIFKTGGDDLFNPFQSIAWMTDLGFVPPGLADKLRDVQLLVLEANHDVELLENDMNRPFSVKQRIMGRHGHLSNEVANEFLQSVHRPAWRKVLLAHISRDCNDLSKVHELFCTGQHPWPIDIVDPQAGPGPFMELSQL